MDDTMENKLTVIIPCKNERHNLPDCIESVRGIADEILIADSGSTDGTLEYVRGLGCCRIIEREYIHSGDFKNWAIPQASHAWILIVDADERVTPQLAAEIRASLEAPGDDTGFWIYRENYFMGRQIRFSGWRSDCVLRLFRRELGRYVGDTDHAEVQLIAGKAGRLRNRLRHFTYTSYDQYFRKMHRFTTYQAQTWYAQGRRPGFRRMMLGGPMRGLYNYIFRLGFLDGYAGLQVCMLTCFYAFMKQARLWELHQHAQQAARKDNGEQPSLRRVA